MESKFKFMSALKYIHIRSFKSIIDQKIDLGQLNVFVGSNGSGKSNFLEAIGMLSAAVSGEISYSKLADRGVRLSSPEVFRSAFSGITRRITFLLEGAFEEFLYRANVTSVAESLGKNTWRYHAEKVRRGKQYSEKIAGRSNRVAGIQGVNFFDKELLKPHRSILGIAESLGALRDNEIGALNSLREFAIYAPSTPILRGVAVDESRKSPLGLYGGGLANALLEIQISKDSTALDRMRKFFELLDWFQMFTVTRPDSSLQSSHVHTGTRVVAFRDQYMPRNFKELYAYDVSEGALYICFVLILLTHANAPNMFALDNVDKALNPGLITNLVSHINAALSASPEKQIFMTTHNPATLDAIDLFDNNHRLFIVKRDKQGATVVDRIAPPTSMTREQWQDKYGYMKLSEIWLSGALKGVDPPAGF